MDKGKPVEITIQSSVDGTEQPNIIQLPADYDGAAPLPLLVGLHSWSADYRQQVKDMSPLALKRRWLLILPNFRGPNLPRNPKPREACASILAQHDIIDSVQYMIENFNVDPKRIYLAGGSGGGHMSQMMAAKYPDLWAGVSAWCGITDIAKWHDENKGYAPGVEACTGGKPGDSPEVDWEYFRRSPVNLIVNARNASLDIRHGRDDKSVPYHHSEDSFRKLTDVGSTKAALDVFAGGHEFRVKPAFEWLAKQVKDDAPPSRLTLITDEAKSYYYAYLVPSEAMKPGRCEIILSEAGIEASIDLLKELRLDWKAMGLKKSEIEITVRKALNPFRLCLDKVPSPNVSCAKKIGRAWKYDDRAGTLTIDVNPDDVPMAYDLKM